MRAPRRKPTDAELGILNVLWSRGPSTVRQIAEEMGREAGYTTILKLLQIMTEKSLVVRDEGSRTHVYTCLLYTSPSPRDRTRSRMPSSA